MRLSPVAAFSSLAAGAVGACVAVVLMGGGHSSQPPATYQIKQDAQTGSVAVITSAAPTSAAPVAPKLAAPSSTVVVRHAAVQQQGAVVTDPTTPSDTTSVAPATSAADPAPTFVPITEHPGNGAPSSGSGNSIPSPTEDASPSH